MTRRPPGRGIVAAVIIFAAALCGCGRSQNADQAPAAASVPAVTVAAAALKSVTPAGTFVGRVQAVNTVNLVSRVEGFLQQRTFTEGQEVKTGDPLFVIEQDTYQAAVDQAHASLTSAQATERNAALALQRSQELVKTNATPQATVDQNIANQATGLGEDGRYLRIFCAGAARELRRSIARQERKSCRRCFGQAECP